MMFIFDDLLNSLISFSKFTLLNSTSPENILLLSGGKDSIIGALLLRLHTKKNIYLYIWFQL